MGKDSALFKAPHKHEKQSQKQQLLIRNIAHKQPDKNRGQAMGFSDFKQQTQMPQKVETVF